MAAVWLAEGPGSFSMEDSEVKKGRGGVTSGEAVSVGRGGLKGRCSVRGQWAAHYHDNQAPLDENVSTFCPKHVH